MDRLSPTTPQTPHILPHRVNDTSLSKLVRRISEFFQQILTWIKETWASLFARKPAASPSVNVGVLADVLKRAQQIGAQKNALDLSVTKVDGSIVISFSQGSKLANVHFYPYPVPGDYWGSINSAFAYFPEHKKEIVEKIAQVFKENNIQCLRISVLEEHRVVFEERFEPVTDKPGCYRLKNEETVDVTVLQDVLGAAKKNPLEITIKSLPDAIQIGFNPRDGLGKFTVSLLRTAGQWGLYVRGIFDLLPAYRNEIIAQIAEVVKDYRIERLKIPMGNLSKLDRALFVAHFEPDGEYYRLKANAEKAENKESAADPKPASGPLTFETSTGIIFKTLLIRSQDGLLVARIEFDKRRKRDSLLQYWGVCNFEPTARSETILEQNKKEILENMARVIRESGIEHFEWDDTADSSFFSIKQADFAELATPHGTYPHMFCLKNNPT